MSERFESEQKALASFEAVGQNSTASLGRITSVESSNLRFDTRIPESAAVS